MTKCPQGCVHPAFGEDTMRQREEPTGKFDFIDVPGHGVERIEIRNQFLECVVCGWVVDI